MMSGTAVKDLKYYLEHTDEMPTDTKEIERLANEHMNAALESGNEQMNVDKIVGVQDAPPANQEAKDDKAGEPAGGKPEEKPAEKPAAPKEGEQPGGEVKPDAILAKDGKNLIPYSQLESARQRAVAAETLARQQAEELAALKAEKTAPVQQPEMLSDDELAALEADSPTLAKTLRAQQAAIQTLRDEMTSVKTRQQSQAAVEEQEVKSEVQSAIDANPTLAAWQTAEDQSMWDEAARFDKLLRGSPKYANVSFADRFAKVVELTRLELGLEAEAPRTVELTQEQIKAAAQAKLKQVTAKSKPVTLSDIPGGAPPAVDERQKVEEMSAVALGQQFMGMTKEQMETYLSTL
jgi:hypothetical protein